MSTVIVTSILSTTTTTTGAVTLTSTLMSTKNSIATTTTSATTTNTTNANNNIININSMKQLITATTTDDILLDELSSRLHGVLPIQPTPLLLPSDHISSSLKSTRLNGHLIYCFVIGGECRLCFPQIISVVLHDVPISDINELFINLNIHISVASQQQLDTLKLAGIMPMTADSCGLITKSDAEHLVAKLLPQCSGYRLATTTTTITAPTTTTIAAAAATTTTTAMIKSYDELMMNDAIPVMHDCFDGCTGILIPMLNCDEQIECTQCKLLFTGEKFVSHSHSIQQIQRICHWGFDSSNWRHYLHLPESYENDLKALQKLELYKYPTMMHRLGKRSASNAFTTIESGSCSKVANLAMTTAPSSSTAIKSIETEAEIGGIGIEITPTITTSSMKSSMNNDFNEYNILKFSTTTTTTTTSATTPITITNTYATTTIADTTTITVVTPTIPSATLTTNSSSFLPIQIPVINDQSSSSSASSGISSINSQLQSLLALQLITSQLPLANESYRLPILTNLPSHLTSDIRWKSIYDMQSSLSSSLLSSSVPLINNNNNSNNNNSNKLTVDMRQITDENLPNKYTPMLSTTTTTTSTTSNNTTISTTTTNNTATATTTTRTNFDIPITSSTTTTSKTAISLEKLLDQTLKEPVLSVAKLLIMEFRREKELLLNQNGQLRRENALLRSALASSTVLVGLKGLTTTNVPIS